MFSVQTPEYDENNYIGRFQAFRKTCNPFHAFYPNSRIAQMQKMIKEQEAYEEFVFKGTGSR